MTTHARYQRRSTYARQGEVVTSTGVDTLTGLPVLVYDLPTEPLRQAEALESEHVPGVLAATFDGGRGEIVAAFSAQYRPLLPEEADDDAAAAGASALRDAAAAGIVHGDLRPGRFLVASGHLLVEGYGVPWRPLDASFAPPEGVPSAAGDVYAFGASFLELGRRRLSPDAKAALEQAVAEVPGDRPTAASLAAELARIAASRKSAPPEARDPEPLVIDTDPGGAPLRTSSGRPSGASTNSGAFSKEPPPGTRYRSGAEATTNPPARFKFPSLHDGRILGRGPRSTYRIAVLAAILVLTAVLAVLAVSRPGDRLSGPAASRNVMYVVDVTVEPANLPPVTLFVAQAPEGSRWQPGTALATVPGRVVLDRAGTWRFQARFQERVSQQVAVEVPEEAAATVVFAPPQSAP